MKSFFSDWKIVVILILIAPIIINFIIISSLNITIAQNNDWIGFWGGYSGGVITLLGVWYTINYYKQKDIVQTKKEKNQKILSVKPYFTVVETDEPLKNDYTIHFTDFNSKTYMRSCQFIIENVGLGTAVNVSFSGLSMYESDENQFSFTIATRDKKTIRLMINNPTINSIEKTLHLIISFSDLFGNSYKQNICIKVDKQLKMQIQGTNAPQLVHENEDI